MRRNGFTLIELMLALAIGGMALSAAALLLLGLSDRGRVIDTVVWRMDRDASAERLLRTLVRNLDFSPDTTPSLKGDATSARFRSWCDGNTGWPVRCFVHLSIAETQYGQAVTLQLWPSSSEIRQGSISGDPTVISLWDRLDSAGLLYLIDASQGGRWTDEWSELVPPPAMGLILDGDTLILPVRRNG